MTRAPGAAPAPKVGILAGGGTLPIEVARAIQRNGGRVHVVAIEGEVDQSLAGIPHTIVNWGGIGAMLRVLREEGCADLVILGRVNRPDLGRVRPDLGFYLSLPAILSILASGGDDSVLRRVVRFFEGRGLRVRGPDEVAPEIVVGAGALAAVEPAPRDVDDIRLGFAIVSALGRFDIGQGVVVRGGQLVAVEGVEGTDAMLRRLAGTRDDAATEVAPTRAGVLVKRPKPGQELRVDMPAIGPRTVELSATAGLAGIGVLAGVVIAAERQRLIETADRAGLFVAGVAEAIDLIHAVPPDRASADEVSWTRIGQVGADAVALSEASLGARALAALSPYAGAASAIVARRHVLAMEPGDDLAALLARVPLLRQWGDKRRKRPLGVVVTSSRAALAAGAPDALAAALREARLGAIALVPDADGTAAALRLAREADRLGIAVLAPMAAATVDTAARTAATAADGGDRAEPSGKV